MGVMLYTDGSVFGGKWQGDLKADGVFIDGSNNWTCGTGGVLIIVMSRDMFVRYMGRLCGAAGRHQNENCAGKVRVFRGDQAGAAVGHPQKRIQPLQLARRNRVRLVFCASSRSCPQLRLRPLRV